MEFPRMVKVRQKFEASAVLDIDKTVIEQLQPLLNQRIENGMRIAITAGSRGISNIREIIRATAQFLKSQGADPFIIPAMGSHGGATAEGQIEVLESFGITERFCGVPIMSSMEVVEIGRSEDDVPVYVDKYAWEADAIVIVGRVKLHTDFKSSIAIESGIMKMAAIGMGKHKQALALHSYGITGIRDMMPRVARVIFEKANILCGIAIVEDAFDRTAVIEAIPMDQIEKREPELLRKSASLMPSLPVSDIDVLIVDEIGKNYSGTGMDTNIIGRLRILGVEEPSKPNIKYILASDLSEESHGNALGIGLADLTTRRLFDKIDFQKMNENVITSSFLHRAMIPIVLDNERHGLEVALRSNWGVPSQQTRIVRIPNTLNLENIYVSESILPELEHRDDIDVVGELAQVHFDNDGRLPQTDF